MEQQPSVRTEQRRSQAAKDSPPFLGSHIRMCSSKSNTGSQESSHSGAQQIETPAHGVQRTAGRRRFPGEDARKRALSRREGVTEKLGEGEDKGNAFSNQGELRSALMLAWPHITAQPGAAALLGSRALARVQPWPQKQVDVRTGDMSP